MEGGLSFLEIQFANKCLPTLLLPPLASLCFQLPLPLLSSSLPGIPHSQDGPQVTFYIEFQTPGWCSRFQPAFPSLSEQGRLWVCRMPLSNKHPVNKQAPCQGGIRSMGDRERIWGKQQLFGLISHKLFQYIPASWLPAHLCRWANTHTHMHTHDT